MASITGTDEVYEPRFSQTSQSSKDHDTEHTRGTTQEPVCNGLVADLGEARLGFGSNLLSYSAHSWNSHGSAQARGEELTVLIGEKGRSAHAGLGGRHCGEPAHGFDGKALVSEALSAGKEFF
jgi:hypothetical protein